MKKGKLDMTDVRLLNKLAIDGPSFWTHPSHALRCSTLRSHGFVDGETAIYRLSPNGVVEMRTRYTITAKGREELARHQPAKTKSTKSKRKTAS